MMWDSSEAGPRGEEESTGKMTVITAMTSGTYSMPDNLYTSYNLILSLICGSTIALCDS